jgi:RHS repeat-associated protein
VRGSIGKFYPYSIERPSATTNGTEKFTGYFRDIEAGNDYAVNRFMSPGFGRFITPDPSRGSFANPSSPGSWNLYTYVTGDPINRRDPRGLDALAEDPDDDGPGWNSGGGPTDDPDSCDGGCGVGPSGDGEAGPTDPDPPTPSPNDPVTTIPTPTTTTAPSTTTDPAPTDPVTTSPTSPVTPPTGPGGCGVALSLAPSTPCISIGLPIMPVGFGNCEAAIGTLESATSRLVRLTAEWIANLFGLRNPTHRENIQISMQNVKDALTRVKNACGTRSSAAAAVAAAATAIAAAAEALSNLIIAEPLPL